MSFASEFDHAIQAVNGQVSRALEAANGLSYEKFKAIIQQAAQSGPVKRISSGLQASREYLSQLQRKVSTLAGDNFLGRLLLAGLTGLIGGALYAAAGSAATAGAAASIVVLMEVVAVILIAIAAYQVLKIGIEAMSKLMESLKRFFDETKDELAF